jgi:all-trans-8'-apo-beta-carotenal 15,15'-oxygenase
MTTTPFDAKSAATTSLGWTSSLRDLSREHGFEPLRVEGSIPAELNGTLYRTGPSLFSSFGKRYGHLFDGDGAVTAVRFANGRALGAAKMVQSEELVAERRAGRQIYGGYGTTTPGLKRFWPPAVWSRLKNPANTSIMLWGERLFALYEGDLPTEIDPTDLATLGERDFGVVVGTFSAHPHAVSARRTIYNFGLRYGAKTMLDIYAFNDAGGARKLAAIPLAHPFGPVSKAPRLQHEAKERCSPPAHPNACAAASFRV